MNKVWILVCTAVRARLFEVQPEAVEWSLVESFNHPEGYESTTELVPDRAGRSSPQGASAHHNALAPKTDPKQAETEHFIRRAAGALDRGLRSQKFSHLVLVAPPHILGMLRKELTPELTKHVLTTVDKDYERLDSRALAVTLRDEVAIPLDQRDVTGGPKTHAH